MCKIHYQPGRCPSFRLKLKVGYQIQLIGICLIPCLIYKTNVPFIVTLPYLPKFKKCEFSEPNNLSRLMTVQTWSRGLKIPSKVWETNVGTWSSVISETVFANGNTWLPPINYVFHGIIYISTSPRARKVLGYNSYISNSTTDMHHDNDASSVWLFIAQSGAPRHAHN